MSDLPRVLIVDSSRVVRASLAKHLQGRFEIREEADGEAAWQTLVLDSSIVAVISGRQMHKLDGYELVERLRKSRLSRLKELPFLLIVSDTECDEGKVKARKHGVSDFITKLMCKGEILGHLTALLGLPAGEAGDAPGHDGGDFSEQDIDSSAILKQVGSLGSGDSRHGKEHLPASQTKLHLLSGWEIEARIARAVTEAANGGGTVSVLALSIDNYEALVRRFGEDMTGRIALSFARLLVRKIGLRDAIGHYRPDCFLIISRDANLGRCYTFAGRVCRSMATAQIAVRGRPVDLAVCAGAASLPEDGAMSASELLALAISRMEATRCSCSAGAEVGGARNASGESTGIPALRALNAELARRPEMLDPYLGSVGLQLLPFLKLLEREFRFGLPLPEMESRLAERARQEEALVQ